MTIAALQAMSRLADDPAGFLDQAIVLARASKLAYDSDAAPIAQALGLGAVTVFPDPGWHPLPNTQGFWFRHGGVAALVFRGTMNAGHWRANLRFSPPEHPNHPWGKVHPGFLGSFEAVIDTVIRPFAAAAQGADIVWLSGHSLGGALAVLTAAWLRIHTGLQPALLTFGQPMPGFPDFCQRFDAELPDRLTRLINRRDIVPRVPGLGYDHAGLPKRITAGLELESFALGAATAPTLSDSEPPPITQAELDAFLDQLEQADLEPPSPSAGQGRDLRPEGALTKAVPWTADHACDRYVENLEAIRRGDKPFSRLSVGLATDRQSVPSTTAMEQADRTVD